MTSLRLLWIAILISMIAAGPAFAESRSDREGRARELFGAGRYAEALDIYTKLYSETTHPTYIRNIGRCYQNMGDADKAISSFREYLRQATDLPPEQRAQVEGYIREMKELKQSAEGTRAPPSQPRPSPEAAPAGLSPAAAPPAAVVIGEKPGGDRTGASRTPAYVVGGAGLAALGVGAFFGLRALSQHNDSNNECPMESCSAKGVSLNDQAKTSARIADITVGAGVIGLGVATYLYLRSTGSAAPRGEASVGLHLLPEVGRSQAGLALESSW